MIDSDEYCNEPKWTPELEQDMQAYHGIDISAQEKQRGARKKVSLTFLENVEDPY